jgi:cell division protein FtsW
LKVDSLNFIKRLNIFSVLFLISFGILLNVSASSVEGLNLYGDNFYFIKRHLTAIILGAIIFNILKNLNINFIEKFSSISMVFITTTLFLVLTYGIVVGGSRRWINLGIVNFQPSELAKPLIILWVAKQISNDITEDTDLKKFVRSIFLPLLCAFLVLLEPDYGTFASICFILLSQIFFSRIKIIYPALTIFASILPLYLVATSSDYRLSRIEAFRKCDYGVDLLGDCFQLHQSRIAISSGGLFGLGPGTSRARWGMLPNSYSDFISSIIGEEYGFFGLFLLVLAFFILISTTFFIAIREKNEIKKLISVGFGSWIFFQTVVNLGGAVGLLPITGIVLPFVSYGSSAMISIFIALGIMYSRDYE